MAGCLNDGVEMRPSFAVIITHQGKRLAGVCVEVRGSDDQTVLFAGTSGPDGTVNVRELKPGSYWLNAELLEISAGMQCFHVSGRVTRKAKKRVTYEWGDMPVEVSNAWGSLVHSRPLQNGTPIWNLLHRSNVPIANATLRLQNPLRRAAYEAVSGPDGQFSFGKVPPGVYVLHVEGGIEPTGPDSEAADLLVELGKTSKIDHLSLTMTDPGGGACGGVSLAVF